MMIRTIQRAAVGGSIKTARLPFDTAVALLGSESAELALDRADAAVRETAARLLFDDELRQDAARSEEHTSELQSRRELVCRLLLEKKNKPVMACNADNLTDL